MMFGGKNGAGVYQVIVNLMPPHDTYIEAFLGSGAIMRRKAPAARSIGLDLDRTMIEGFQGSDDVELYRTDALAWLRNFVPTDRTLIYCDPPYVHSTRGSQRYKHEMSDEDHRTLLGVLKRLDCQIMISGYQNPIYFRSLTKWRSVSFQAMTRGGVRTETIWMNFDPGEQHYHTFAGKDRTDRQRIKRKAERWARRYEALPLAERQAVFAAMIASTVDADDCGIP